MPHSSCVIHIVIKLRCFSLITGNVKAIFDIWFVGNMFIKTNIDELFNLKKKAITKRKPIPYIFDMFNIKGYWSGLTARGLPRLLNPITDAFNDNHRLPKYIIIIPDKDLLMAIRNRINFGTSRVLGVTVHYLIKQIDKMIQRRMDDLMDKRPGAIAAVNAKDSEHPQVIWVHMLKCPKMPNTTDTAGLLLQDMQDIFSLRGKFNSIIEECIFEDGHGKHFIMSIEVDQNDFTPLGDLIGEGSTAFWKEIDRAVKKFDRGEITLKPRRSQSAAPNGVNMPMQPKFRSPHRRRDNQRHKLPTLPSRRRLDFHGT